MGFEIEILICSITVLVIALVSIKLKSKKPPSVKADMPATNTVIDFLPEMVLKSISGGNVTWEIQIHNIGQQPIKVLRAKAIGSCLLLDKSKYIISSEDNLIKTQDPEAFNNTKRIDFSHRFNPDFMPHKIRLGCSLEIQNQDGHIKEYCTPLLFSKSFLFTDTFEDGRKLEHQSLENISLKKA